MDPETDARTSAAIPSAEIRLRDPFILVDRTEGRYWLYGTTDPDPWHGPGVGFDAWWSPDLARWAGPVHVFRPPAGFWADRNFWAPEVHRNRSRLVMLASFRGPGVGRGVQPLVAERPDGPFVPVGESPLTPTGWECLDGTLFVAGDGVPWLVFCREWVEVDDGRMCALPLTDDLTSPVGEPVELFRASSAPWARPVQECHQFVTDGPFLHHTASGALAMLWSSFGRGGYAVGTATSASGDVLGPWRHARRPLIACDGGHGMLFRDLSGRLRLAFHAPNRSPLERLRLVGVDDSGDRLRLEGSRPQRWWRRITGG